MAVIPGSCIKLPVKYGSRWLISIEALNLLVLDFRISRNTYWTLYKLVAVRFRSSIEYYRMLNQIHARDKHCVVCTSVDGLEMDHHKQLILFPKRGLLKSNLRLLCYKCHKKKSNRERVDDFFAVLSEAYLR